VILSGGRGTSDLGLPDYTAGVDAGGEDGAGAEGFEWVHVRSQGACPKRLPEQRSRAGGA
jgi:hypothetical protein